MTNILAGQQAKARAKGAALIKQADRLLSESWNERMWADGEPIAAEAPVLGLLQRIFAHGTPRSGSSASCSR